MVPAIVEKTLAECSGAAGCDDDWRSADVICGGFPCQDISNAGDGTGITGARSGLWAYLCGAIRMVRPKYGIVENVAALLNRGMDTVCGDLAEIGYDTEWHCIPAANVGAPHLRDRCWIVAHTDAGRWGADVAGRNNADRENAGWAETDGMPGAVRQNGDKREMAAVTDTDSQGGLQPGWLFRYLRRWINDGAPAFAGWKNPWPQVLSEISGMDDGVSTRMDRLGCDALGNTIIPQIPEMIGRAIMLAEGHSAQDF